MKNKLFWLSILLFSLSACTHLQTVSLTQIPSERRHQVYADAEQLFILRIAVDNDFVNEAVEKLKQQCPEGKVQGILTKYYVTDYFLFVISKRVVEATGYCVKPGRV